MRLSGRAGPAYVLICVGGNWTRNVDYHTPQAISAADGAGAVVMGPSDDPAKWAVVDQHTITDTAFYGSMYTDGNLLQVSPPQGGHDQLWTAPFFQITPAGIKGFKEFGAHTTPLAGKELLQRHGLTGADVTLMSHQASTVLMDAWEQVIQPAQYIKTIESFANMAPANVPVTLAWAEQNEPVEKDHLLLLSIGPDMHANALLLRRQ